MATKSPRRMQAARERKALRKLKDVGLFTGKLPRGKPSKSQKTLINKYADVVAGKASVIKPADAKSYKKLYRTKGGLVVVPRRKGERISVDKKTGEIVGKRKVGGRIVKSRFKKVRAGEEIPRPATRKQYAIPFIRGTTTTGEPIINWMRWPSYDELQGFMGTYDYKDWPDYVVEEEVGKELPNEMLDAILADRGIAPGFRMSKRAEKRNRKKGMKIARRSGVKRLRRKRK